MINSIFYIYAHYTKDTNVLFYIGKGKHTRALDIVNRNTYWKRIVKTHGYNIVYLKQMLSEQLAFKYEKYFIKKLKPKANFTAGGTGGNTKIAYTDIQKNSYIKKCSESKKLFWSKIPKSFRSQINKSNGNCFKDMWKNMNNDLKSIEQSRRSCFRAKNPVYCVSNSIFYKSATDAAKDLGIKNPCHIRRVARGERSHVKHYKFKYVTSELTDIVFKTI